MTSAALLAPPGLRSVGASRPARVRGWATPARTAPLALVATGASVPPLVLLHLDAPARLSAGTTTLSDYVVLTPGGGLLFALATGALALAALAIARGPAGPVGRVLLLAWSVALVLVAVFPTNRPGTPADTSSTIHLLAGAVVFGLPPIVGLIVGRSRRRSAGPDRADRTLVVTTTLSAVVSAALILNRIPGLFGLDQLSLPPGLLQRASGILVVLLTAVLARAVLTRPGAVRPPS